MARVINRLLLVLLLSGATQAGHREAASFTLLARSSARPVHEKLIEAEPLATNLRRLMYHRRGPELSHQALEEVMATFNEWPPMTVADLLYVVGEGKAWRLLGLGVVGIDLDRSIDTDSPVFLQGGHRHANLFP